MIGTTRVSSEWKSEKRPKLTVLSCCSPFFALVAVMLNHPLLAFADEPGSASEQSAQAATQSVRPVDGEIQSIVAKDGKKLPIVDRTTFDHWTDLGIEAFFPLLNALETTDPVAKNWTRAALEKIVADASTPLPVKELLELVRDPDAIPDARRFALRLLEQSHPDSTGELWNDWLGDPVFGPEAVSRLLQRVDELLESEQKDSAAELLNRALESSLSFRQAVEVAKRLEELEIHLDLPAVMGVVRQWSAIGPFPVTAEEGLHQSFFPEEEIDFSQSYQVGNVELSWTSVQADLEQGRVDLAAHGFLPSVGSVAYAATEIVLPEAFYLVLFASAVDNLTVWVNGQQVIHHASLYRSHYRQDRYRADVSLPAGTSSILVKLCKTPPDAERAAAADRMGAVAGGRPEKWDFMLRSTDREMRGVQLAPVDTAP